MNGGVANTIVWSGYTVIGNAENNTVNLNGSRINGTIYSGDVVGEGNANNNTVNVRAGIVNGDIIAGRAVNGNADNNTVNIYDGKIAGDINVGRGTEAKNNTVNWYGGIVDGTISGDNIYDNIYGNWTKWNWENSNSSFNFYASDLNSNKKIAGLKNFKNYNFYIGDTIIPNTTLITVNSGIDLTKSNIGIYLSTYPNLVKGDSLTLLSSPNWITTRSNSDKIYGENIFDIYEIDLNNDGNNLKATLGDIVGSNPKNEMIAGGRQPEVAFIDDKLDIVDTAYNMSVGKSEPVVYFDFNYSDVKKDNISMRGSENVIGSATTKGDEGKKNTITQGPFLEYGDGSFGGKNFYSTGGVEASGKTEKYGTGYLFRQVRAGRHHYDAYFRLGKIKNDFRSNMDNVGNVNYDNSDMYYAAHLGYGQYVPIDPHTKMDVYGKYFYKVIPGTSTTTHVNSDTDINTDFDKLDSHKFRIGSKITWDYMQEKKKMMFADVALEHELSHTQRTTLGDRTISNSSGADTTGVIELGYRQVFGPNDAFLFTADLQGYVGTRSGLGGNIGVRFNF